MSKLIAGLLLCFLFVSASSKAVARDIIVKPVGEFAKIDSSLCNKTIDELKSASTETRNKAIADIKAAPDKYAPPVFYLLSSVLFQEGKKDDAMFWFYAGQLRARYDANRCADISARSGVGVLNMQFGTPINQYAFTDIPRLKELVSKVVEWDRKTPHNYDHRWINLHGMEAMLSGMEGKEDPNLKMSLPENEWEAIAEKTRSDYLNGFNQAMAELKKRQE